MRTRRRRKKSASLCSPNTVHGIASFHIVSISIIYVPQKFHNILCPFSEYSTLLWQVKPADPTIVIFGSMLNLSEGIQGNHYLYTEILDDWRQWTDQRHRTMYTLEVHLCNNPKLSQQFSRLMVTSTLVDAKYYLTKHCCQRETGHTSGFWSSCALQHAKNWCMKVIPHHLRGILKISLLYS